MYMHVYMASQVALVVKNSSASAEKVRDSGLIPGSGRSPGESHGQRSLVGCGPQGCKEQTWLSSLAQHGIDVLYVIYVTGGPILAVHTMHFSSSLLYLYAKLLLSYWSPHMVAEPGP